MDDRYDDHPKVVAAGNEAELVDQRGMRFCARHETDGFIPYTHLNVLARGIRKPEAVAERLVAVGRWVDDKERGGWWVHDFLDYNPSAAEKESDRADARSRMAKTRSARGSPEVRPNNGRSSPYPHPSPPRVPSEHSFGDFERFWAVYPRKVAKKAAHKAWKARIRAGQKAEVLIRAAQNYAKAVEGKEQQFVLHPTTFLGPSERFEDYIEPPKESETIYR